MSKTPDPSRHEPHLAIRAVTSRTAETAKSALGSADMDRDDRRYPRLRMPLVFTPTPWFG